MKKNTLVTSLENEYIVEKKFFGQFFTKDRITEYITSKMNLDENTTIADLSCGDGAFLLSCYNFLRNKKILPKNILQNIYGIEIQQKYLDTAKNNILNCSVKNAHEILNKNLILGDTIKTKPEDLMKKFPNISREGGFDVIVGNPPYVTVESTKEIKSDPVFSQIVFGPVNAATLMIGRAFLLLKNGGKLGLLLPKTIFRVDSYKKLREFILSKFSIEEIIDVGIEFEDVRGEQVILIATKKSKKPKNIKIGYFLKNKQLEIYSIPFQQIIKFDNFLLLHNLELYKLVDKIVSNHQNLEQCSNGKIYRGITVGANSKFVSKNPHENYFKGLRGDSVKKFSYDYYIFIQKKNYPKLDMIKQKKIVLQNIFSSESGIIANYDDLGLVTLDTVTNVILENEDPYYVLGVLNSSLIRFFMVFAIYNQSRLTMHADRSYIGRIPIPKTSQKNKNEIIDEVKNQIKTQTDLSKLDELVFGVFGLDKSEKNQVFNQLEKFKQMGRKNGK